MNVLIGVGAILFGVFLIIIGAESSGAPAFASITGKSLPGILGGTALPSSSGSLGEQGASGSMSQPAALAHPSSGLTKPSGLVAV